MTSMHKTLWFYTFVVENVSKIKRGMAEGTKRGGILRQWGRGTYRSCRKALRHGCHYQNRRLTCDQDKKNLKGEGQNSVMGSKKLLEILHLASRFVVAILGICPFSQWFVSFTLNFKWISSKIWKYILKIWLNIIIIDKNVNIKAIESSICDFSCDENGEWRQVIIEKSMNPTKLQN